MQEVRNGLKIKHRSIKLSLYFGMLMSALIIIISAWFAVLTFWNVKNLAGAYEGDADSLKNALARVLIQTIASDVKSAKGFDATKKVVDVLNDETLMSYVYIINNSTKKPLFKTQEQVQEIVDESKDQDIIEFSRDMGEFTVYYAFPRYSRISEYSLNFFTELAKALVAIITLGAILSFYMSKIISKPLDNLASAAKRFTKRNFNAIEENSNFNELNDLIDSYNQMALQLNDLYSSLELKVQERTIALKEANHKLQETQAMMVHSEKMRSLGELVAGIAHEINNPINFIYGNIVILQNYTDDLLKLIDLYEENSIQFPKEIRDKIIALREDIDIDFLRGDIKELIGSCIEGTQRTKNIILDLKNFSRMEAMVLTHFDVPKEIDTTLNILNNKLKNRITVVKNYNEDVPKIEAYGGQLNQVFMNIIDNAQDAMGEKGTLTINTKRVDENVIIEFIDTGSGIAKENLKKVFEPFFTTKVVGKGTGLGMSISYRVIKDHNGKIEVDSILGKGTKFTITLPIEHISNNGKQDKDKIV